MQRYLLNFSYLGTTFRGLQRQVTGLLPRQDDPSTIQGCLEMALQRIDAKNMPFIVPSSRTDTGVHALNTTCHVDLESPNEKPYEPRFLTMFINKLLSKWGLPIKIINVYAVPETFHCRYNAVKRTYLYRLIVIKPDILTPLPLLQHIPIELYDRAWFPTCPEFEIDSMREAAKLFLGYHDFKTFSAKDTSTIYQQKYKITRRTISKFTINESPMNLYSAFSIPTLGLNKKSIYKSYDIYIESTGFLHNQLKIINPLNVEMSFLLDLQKAKRNLIHTKTVITYADGQCLTESRTMTLPVEIERKPYGFIVDNKPDDKPAKILDYLYLGSQDCCLKEVLLTHNISNILSIGIETPLEDPQITSHFLECLDLPETNIWDTIKKSAVVIKNSVNKCESILVHCNAGVSRSASVVIGYLILDHNYSFLKAFEHVRSARCVIRPNDGFMKQLREYHLYI